MTLGCAPAFTDQFVVDMVNYADCQARTLGAWGYVNLAGSPMMSTLLFVTLSFAIALFGLKMLSGRVPQFRDVISLTATIGIVLTSLFSWPAVRVLVYDTVFDGPASIAGSMLGAQAPSVQVTTRLQRADGAVQSLILGGTGREQLGGMETRSGRPASEEFHSQGISDDIAFGGGRYLLLASALMGLAGLKLVGAVLIALLPLLSVLLLFRATMPMFLGAMGGLAGLIFANVGALLILMAELQFLEPWLAAKVAARASNYAIASAPVELLLIASLFALLQGAVIFLSLRLAGRLASRSSIVVNAETRREQQTHLAPTGLVLAANGPLTVPPQSREFHLIESLARRSSFTGPAWGAGQLEAAAAQNQRTGGVDGNAGSTSIRRDQDRPTRISTKRDGQS